MLFLIAIDKASKKEMQLGWGLKLLMIVGLIILMLLAAANIYSIFIK
jgi:hypothetical protein